MRLFRISLAIVSLAAGQAVPVPAASAPIPDLPALFKEIEANQNKMDEVRENFTFHRIRRTDDLDKNGAVIKTTTQEREIFFVNGHQIGRLVKRDGVALSAPEEKSEQARVKRLIETNMKIAPTARQRGGGTGLISQVLAVTKVSNPRRLSLNGRDTLAFDFAGDPNARAHDTGQSAAKKMAGTIWIDEADRQVARLEVRLDDNFHLAGGLLASIQKGTTMQVEQAPVGQGLWLQTTNESHVAARLVVKSFRQNLHVRDFDFRRFDVGVLQQISPPSK
jgi:hypothetical protein